MVSLGNIPHCLALRDIMLMRRKFLVASRVNFAALGAGFHHFPVPVIISKNPELWITIDP